jgi:hypothetical protein
VVDEWRLFELREWRSDVVARGCGCGIGFVEAGMEYYGCVCRCWRRLVRSVDFCSHGAGHLYICWRGGEWWMGSVHRGYSAFVSGVGSRLLVW